jgi:microcystin-dependent protein
MPPYVGEIILVGFNFAPTGWAFCNGQLLPIAENETLFQLIGTTYGGDGQTTFALPDLRGRVPIHQGQGPGLQGYFIGETGGSETVTLVTAQMAPHGHAVDINSLTGTLRCRNGAANQLTPVGNVPAIEADAPFTDATLVAGTTPVRASHIIELRARVDALRVRVGLMPFAWSDLTLAAGATAVRAQHLIDLRTALTQASAAGGLPLPVYAEPIAAGTTIKAAHVTELRNAVLARPAGPAATYSSAAPDATMHAATIQMGGSVTAGAAGGSQPHGNVQPYLALNYLISLFGIFPSQG